MRTKTLPLLVTVLLSAAFVPGVSARAAKPVIKGEEVGYFGSATVTHHISMFVYTNFRAGVHVTVCMNGRCKVALGHSKPAPWYSVSFISRGLRMGDRVRFTVRASDSAGVAKATVVRMLLCMHNNGSTPQH